MKIFKKILIGIIIFFVIIFIYQISFSKNISFSNHIIDRYFYYSQTDNVIFILFLLLCLLLSNSKQTWEKVISIALLLPTFIILFIGVVTVSRVVFSNSASIRHYYFYKNGYSYYMMSEERLNIKMYKEKPVFIFIKERKVVNENELKANGINYSEELNRFLIKYSK